MSSMTRLAFLIGAVLVATASLVIHKSETAFAQPEAICRLCLNPAGGSLLDRRADCDDIAFGEGFSASILRPVNPRDPFVELCFVELCDASEGETLWLCLGI